MQYFFSSSMAAVDGQTLNLDNQPFNWLFIQAIVQLSDRFVNTF